MYELKTGNGILSGALAVLVAMAVAFAWAGETADGGLFDIRDGVLCGMTSNGEEEITVPAGVKSVCIDGLVNGRMKTLVIPEGVERIDRQSGGYRPGAVLETIRLPSSVKEIGVTAFDGHWRHLRAIEIADGSPYSMQDGCLVDTRDSSLVFALPGRGRIAVPGIVKIIGPWAFFANDATDITIPEGVTEIGRGAFDDCRMLETLSIPASVEEIGNDAFSKCGKLGQIGVSADNPRYAVRDGLLLDRKTATLLRAFGPLVRVTIPEEVETIGDSAFSFQDSLVSVTVPDTVRRIENGAFSYCRNLEELHLPEQLDYCDSHFIMGCKTLGGIRLPVGLETVHGNFSFGRCDGLRELVFPEGLRTIGSGGLGAVCECANLVRISIPASVTTIGKGGAFMKNPRLAAIDVHPDNPAFCSVNGVLFSKDMRRLVRCPETKAGVYEIPESVERIDNHAFANCHALTEIRIPSGATDIGHDAFLDCPAKTVQIDATEESTTSPADANMDGADDTDGGLPIAKFPVDGIVAGFTFNDQDKAADFVKNGRKFMASGLPRGSASRAADDLVKDGALQFPGGHAWESHVHLGVPELRYDRFTVGMNFRPVFGGRSPLPLVSFGGGWRWFHVLLRPDGTPVVAFRGLAGGNELSFPLPAKFRPDEWNWIAVAFDVASHRLSAVVDGRRIPDIALPDDFAFRFNREEREKCRTIEFANLNNGTVFKGEINGFLLFDRAFTDAELEAIAIASDGEATPWVFQSGEEDAGFYWNGTVSDGLVTLDARLSDGKVSVALPDVLSVPGGVLNLRKLVLDGQGVELALVGIGEEDSGQSHIGFGGRRRDMTAVLLPETLEWIGPGAFERCKNLTSLTIPAAVERIGQKAFLGCPALEKLEFENRSFHLSDSVFGDSETGGDTHRPATNLLSE